MKEYTPYVIAFVTQTIAFVVWIVKSNNDFNKKIAIMETKVKSLEKQQDITTADQKEIYTKLSVLSELMAVCKNTVDWVLAKSMKKGLI